MVRLFLGLAILAAGVSQAANAGDLTVEVRGAASARGSVYVALFDAPAAFPNKPTIGVAVPAGAKPARAVFRQLKPGIYAVSSFHDANGNGTLDTNAVGMPTEKYGFGNDAMGFAGPPSFKAASVTMGASSRTIVINLRQ